MSNAPHILVIDDEPQILRAIRTILTEKQFRVTTASRGEEGLTLAAANEPDLIILDLGLPDMDGVEVCMRLREWTQTPIIILSVRDSERDKVAALDSGADDYLTKPFGMGELLARVRASLRRSPAAGPEATAIEEGDFRIDLESRAIQVDGKEVRLSPKEFDLLVFFMRNTGKVLTHRTLLAKIWGGDYTGQTEYLRVFVRHLRKKIEPDPAKPRYILTEPWVGYRFRSSQ